MAIFEQFDKKKYMEMQTVYCLNCIEIRDKAIKRIRPQIDELKNGEHELILKQLQSEKIRAEEKLNALQNKITKIKNKDYQHAITELEKELYQAEKRKILRTLRIEKEYSTEMCGCGCDIGYNPKPNRNYGLRKFIRAEDHQKNFKEKMEKQELMDEMKKKGIDIKVVHKSKTGRTMADTSHEDDEITKLKINAKEMVEN
jgi:hypothetical protein